MPKELIRHLDGPDLLRMKPGQCLLVTDQPVLLPMEIYETPIWIDNMYIRVGSQASLKNPGGLTLLDATKMYLTNVTIQGDGTTDSRASDGQYASIFGKTRTFYARGVFVSKLLCLRFVGTTVCVCFRVFMYASVFGKARTLYARGVSNLLHLLCCDL